MASPGSKSEQPKPVDQPEPRLDTEHLLEHTVWMTALARSLVGDISAAEDVVQETWIALLDKPPRDPRASPSWLARVLRNLANRLHRGERNRRRRESLVARKEHVPAAAENLLERAELQRQVVDEVIRLDEPYRSTVLLRFFEQLPFTEIARRQDVPVSTVKSRLKKSLETLRERLDRLGGGDRRTWIPALMPLALAGAGDRATAAATECPRRPCGPLRARTARGTSSITPSVRRADRSSSTCWATSVADGSIRRSTAGSTTS